MRQALTRLLALASVARVVLVGALTALSYPEVQHAVRPFPQHIPPLGTPPQPCEEVSFAEGAQGVYLFESNRTCLGGLDPWGSNVMFAWVSSGPVATVELGWDCVEPYCPLATHLATVINATGSFGYWTFDLTTIGSAFYGSHGISLWFWVLDSSATGSPLAPGQTVQFGYSASQGTLRPGERSSRSGHLRGWRVQAGAHQQASAAPHSEA